MNVYFSFAPELPIAPDTETARAMLEYAYVDFQLKQPDRVGGSLRLLSDLNLLHLDDFESFEIRGGQLVWRLTRQSSDHYLKFRSLYDADPSNDPDPSDDCVSGDIAGRCACEFTGPTVNVIIDWVATAVTSWCSPRLDREPLLEQRKPRSARCA